LVFLAKKKNTDRMNRQGLLRFFGVVVFGFLLHQLHAQSITPSVINTTGGTSVVGNLVVDWNVGELMVSTQTNGIIVTNGQLQPVDQIISVEELNSSWNISVYPNPTRDEFVITAPNSGIYEASLFDLAGKFISKQILMNTNRMDVRSLANGSYFLQVRNTASQEFKTITLIKAN
jgi:hypothetical protein